QADADSDGELTPDEYKASVAAANASKPGGGGTTRPRLTPASPAGGPWGPGPRIGGPPGPPMPCPHPHNGAMDTAIEMVGFDADDTLWRSEDYFHAAQDEFEQILARHVDLADARVRERLYAVERGNIAVFGYGVKGMALSMVEAAVDITGGSIPARELHRIVQIAKDMLRHPVELLPGVREAVEAVAAEHAVVLITKGDLFHQEAKVRDSGLSSLFRRIEIVSEKDAGTYARLLDEFQIPADRFVMVGNSLRSDIVPVLRLGGWGVHVPYHLTWAHENEADDVSGHPRLRHVASAAELPRALRGIVASAAPTAIAG